MGVASSASRFALLLLLAAGAATAQSLPPGAAWTLVPGSELAFAAGKDGPASWYALSLDRGASVAALEQADYTLLLRHGSFDPLEGEPPVPEALRAMPGSRLAIVQYLTPGMEAYRAHLRALGAEPVHFLAHHADVVRLDRALWPAVRALPFVRWVGAFHPAYRLDPELLPALAAESLPRLRYNVQVTTRDAAAKAEIAASINAAGGEALSFEGPGLLMQADLDAGALIALLHRDDVFFADLWSAPEADMDVARTLGGANYVEGVTGFTGAGVRGEVLDGGLFTAHADFQTNPPLLHGANTSDTSHGTSTFGIVFGYGSSNPMGRGMLPDAQPIFAAYPNLGDRFVHTQELLSAPYNAVFQSNSWGSNLTTAYTTISAEMDDIIFNLDFLICQSQSNAGTQSSRPQAWAKGIVSCGGIRHVNTLSTADDNWTGGASIGPAADGRIKPDISAFYDNIFTTSNSGAYTSTFGGTSGATPIIAGHFGLMFQMWSMGAFNNVVVPGLGVFGNRPHATTAKALMLNSATQYPFTGTSADLTRVHQGWGRPDIQRLWDRRLQTTVVNETDVLAALQSTSYSFNVVPGETLFQATLVFADPPGNPGSSVARINDLTLRVTAPSGTQYFGNNGLLAGTVSTAGGAANTVDTVEQVIVANPTPGTWTVEVIASEINQDAHLETPAVDADYALVVSGADPVPPGPPDTGQANSPAASMVVLFAQNLNGQGAAYGVNGPFFLARQAGQPLTFSFTGPPNRPFLLLSGPLLRNNAVFPGVGSLDIGMGGATGDFSDVVGVLNGLSPTTFLELLANTGASGAQVLSFTVPATLLPGTLGTFQAVVVDPMGGTLQLTAATEVTIL